MEEELLPSILLFRLAMRHKDVAGYDAEGGEKNLDLLGMHLLVDLLPIQSETWLLWA